MMKTTSKRRRLGPPPARALSWWDRYHLYVVTWLVLLVIFLLRQDYQSLGCYLPLSLLVLLGFRFRAPLRRLWHRGTPWARKHFPPRKNGRFPPRKKCFPPHGKMGDDEKRRGCGKYGVWWEHLGGR